MKTEVKYERLRPEQIAVKRLAFPVAYLPIGTIEWHGEHNPVGLDTLKIHELLVRCAQNIGGLVFPPLYYGENREQGLMEANAADREKIANKMQLPGENFDPGYMIEPVSIQNRNYQNLLIHIFHEIKSLGFKVLIIGAGHYPLLVSCIANRVKFDWSGLDGELFRNFTCIPSVFALISGRLNAQK